MDASVVEDRTKSQEGNLAFAMKQLALLKEGFSFSGYERDLVAMNLGNGKFLEISGASGADSVSDGRAAVYLDFDDDGDLDLYLKAMHGQEHFLFRNEVGHESRSVRILLEGRKSGRDAFGAVVRMKTPAGILTRMKAGGSGFCAQSDPRLLFGLGGAERAEWIEVSWPSGLKQRLEGPRGGETVKIMEGARGP